jgi:tRNA(fMet)-specific endonuclease VapC
LAEIDYGIEKSPVKKKERHTKIEQIRLILEVHAFDEPAAADYGTIRAQLEKKGIVISERGLQIASIAVSKGLRLITHNVKAFHRVDRLKVEDWAQD